MLARLCWLVLLISFTFSIQAHQMSTGYLNLDLSSSQGYGIQGQLQLRWFDVDSQIKLDNNLDGQLQWQEVLSQKTQILQFIQANLSIQANQQQCVLNMTDGLRSDSHFDEGYLSIALFADCKSQSAVKLKRTQYFLNYPIQEVGQRLIRINVQDSLVNYTCAGSFCLFLNYSCNIIDALLIY